MCISLVPDVRVLGVTITQNLKWATHVTLIQKSAANMQGILNHLGSSLNTNCRCRILQVFILPKLSHCTPVWCCVGNLVINALHTTLRRATHIALRQKTATLDRNTYETTGLLPFRMYRHYKCHYQVNSLLLINNNKQYLPSQITELNINMPHAALLSTSFDNLNTIGQMMKNELIKLQPNYGIIYIGLQHLPPICLDL